MYSASIFFTCDKNSVPHSPTAQGRVVPEKEIIPHLVTKLPAFHGNRNFITAFTRDWILPLLSHINPVHALQSYLFNIIIIIIIMSTPRYSKRSLFLQDSPQTPCKYFSCLSQFHMPCQLILADMNTFSVSGEEQKSWSPFKMQFSLVSCCSLFRWPQYRLHHPVL